jgi:hypothetical protein
MALPNILTAPVTAEIIGRINSLSANTQPNWGKMSVAQMLAHCCVTYEMVFEDKYPKPNFFVGFMLKTFLKSTVVSEKPYSQNGGTAPQFVIKETKDFEVEKARLIGFIEKTQQLGENHFDGKESHSFGNLSKTEWNNMFYKHLNHHLTQFGV